MYFTAALLLIPQSTKATTVQINSQIENDVLSVIFSHAEDAFPVINCKSNGTIFSRFYRPITSIKTNSSSIKMIKYDQEDKRTIKVQIIENNTYLKHEIKIGKTQSVAKFYLVKEEPTKQKHISVSLNSNGVPVISMPSKQPIAIFKKREELWVVLHDAHQNAQLLLANSMQFRQIKSDKGLVLAWNTSKFNCLKLHYEKENIEKVILVNDQIAKHNIEYKELSNKHFWHINSEYKTCKIYDEITGEYIDVIAISNFPVGISQEKSFANFDLQNTLQGIQFVSQTPNLQLIEEKDGVSIAIVPEDIAADSALPWSYDGSFFTQKQELEEALNNANTPESQQLCKKRLASLYFSKSHYHESSSMLNRMQDADLNDTSLRLMQAISNYLVGDINNAQRAIRVLNSFQKPKSRELILWTNLIQGVNIQKSLLEDIQNFISEYPDEVYWKLVFDYLERSLNGGQITDVQALLSKIRSSSNLRIKEKLAYYKAMLNYQNGKTQAAIQALTNLASSAVFEETKMMAKMQIVKVRYKNNQIAASDAIKELEDFLMTRENSELEKALLLQIADLYRDQNAFIEELRILKYLKDFLDPDPLCTSRMDKLYTKIFLTKEVLDNMPIMYQLAAFYEFQSLMPTGNTGDLIALKIAKHLFDLDLLNHAEEILEHQVRHRMVGKQKIMLSEHLAYVFLANNKAEKALSVLSSLESSSLTEHQRRLRLKAIAAMEDGKYANALEFLFKDVSREGFIIKKEILFRANKWKEYIELTTPEILSFITTKNVKMALQKEQDALRFMTCCVMTQNQDAIKMLIEGVMPIDANFAQLLSNLNSDHPLESYAQLNSFLGVNQIEAILNQYKFDLQNFSLIQN